MPVDRMDLPKSNSALCVECWKVAKSLPPKSPYAAIRFAKLSPSQQPVEYTTSGVFDVRRVKITPASNISLDA